MASGESSQQEGRSWLNPVRILSGVKSTVTSTASTLYQATGFGQIGQDNNKMAAKEVGMNDDNSDWVMYAVS